MQGQTLELYNSTFADSTFDAEDAHFSWAEAQRQRATIARAAYEDTLQEWRDHNDFYMWCGK